MFYFIKKWKLENPFLLPDLAHKIGAVAAISFWSVVTAGLASLVLGQDEASGVLVGLVVLGIYLSFLSWRSYQEVIEIRGLLFPGKFWRYLGLFLLSFSLICFVHSPLGLMLLSLASLLIHASLWALRKLYPMPELSGARGRVIKPQGFAARYYRLLAEGEDKNS